VYPICVPVQRLFVDGFRYNALELIYEKSPNALEKSPRGELYMCTLYVYPICVPLHRLFVNGFRSNPFEPID